MTDFTHELIDCNGISIHVVSSGPLDGPPVVLCHGFPETWYSWRHQLRALGDAGYRALALDWRGYSESSHPKGDVGAYGSDKLTGDLRALLDYHGYEKASFVGHDWGAIVLWEMGRLHPSRVASIYNMSVPFTQPRVPPTEAFEAIFAGRFFYILYFQPVGPAEAELEAQTRRFIRNTFYSLSGEGMREGPSSPPAPREGTGMLDVLREAPDQLPDWLTEDDVDVYADSFARGGFFGPLSFYRNMDANWERSRDVAPSTLSMPVGFLTGSLDLVKAMTPGAAETMRSALPDFRGATEIDGIGHWVQQEAPEQTNRALMDFLASLS